MDMNYMMKLAKRNNLSLKTDHLREDIVKESTTIIKLRVSQGFAFCDLKENYEQLENNHERLHHNMLEVQMQHEDISGQFQEELRLRPQTLNKVHYTRSLCETLEECCSLLKKAVASCQANQAKLYRAYETSERALLDSRQEQEKKDQHYELEINTLNKNLNVLKEEKCKIEKELLEEKQQTNDTKNTLLRKTEMIIHLKDQMAQIINKMSETVDNKNKEIAQRDEIIFKTKDHVKQLAYEYETQCMKIKNENMNLEKALEACTAAKDALEVSLKESADNSKSLMDKIKEQEKSQASLLAENLDIRDKFNSLNDKLIECQNNEANKQQEIFNLNEAFKNMSVNNEELTKELQNFESTVKDITNNNEHLKDVNETLSKQLCECKEEVTVKINALENLKVVNETLSKQLCECKEEVTVKINTIENIKIVNETLSKQLHECMEEITVKINANNETNSLNAELRSEISRLQENGKVSDEKIEELMKMLDTKQRELNQQAVNISTLMNDVKNITDAKTRIEAMHEKKMKICDDKIVQYMEDLKDKDEKLEKNFKIIVEIRAEKTRLQEKISSLEKTIGNIHKQVANRYPSSGNVRVASKRRETGSSTKDDSKHDEPQHPSPERASSKLDNYPILRVFSNNNSDDSQSFTTMYHQSVKRTRQEGVVSKTQETYNPYSSVNIETEMTTRKEEKPRTFFKTKRNQSRGKKTN